MIDFAPAPDRVRSRRTRVTTRRVVAGALVCSAALFTGVGQSDAARKSKGSGAEAIAPMVSPLICANAAYFLDGVPSGNAWHLEPGQAYSTFNVRYAVSESGNVVADAQGWEGRDLAECTWVTPSGTTWYVKGVLR